MQVSIDLSPEIFQQFEASASSLGKSINEVVAVKLETGYEKKQRANKALAEFLKPTITALKNGEVSDKSPDEIFKEIMESVMESQR